MDEEPRDNEDRKPVWQASDQERQIDADAYHIWTPRPLIRSVYWRPDPEPPRDSVSGSYEVFLDQRAFVAMHEHVWKADAGQSRFGYLIGDLCEDPSASRRFVIITAVVPSRFAFDETGPEQIGGEAAVALQLEVERRRGVLVGWYHSHPSGDVVLSAEDVATHERLFADPWQVAFLFVSDPSAPAGACFRRTPAGLDGELRLPFYEMATNESLLAKGVRRSRVDWENVSTLDEIRLDPPPRPDPPPVPEPLPDSEPTAVSDLIQDAGPEPDSEEVAPDISSDESFDIPVEESVEAEEPVEVQEPVEVEEETAADAPAEDAGREDDKPEPDRGGEPETPEFSADSLETGVVDSSEPEGVVEEDDDDLDFDALIAEVESAGLSDDGEMITTEALEAVFDLGIELEPEPVSEPVPEPELTPDGDVDVTPEPDIEDVQDEPTEDESPSPTSEPAEPEPEDEYESLVAVESELSAEALEEVESELASAESAFVEPSIPAEDATASVSVPDRGRILRNRILAGAGVAIALGVVWVLIQVFVIAADGGADQAGSVIPAAVDLPSAETAEEAEGSADDEPNVPVEDPSGEQMPEGVGAVDEGADSSEVVAPPQVEAQAVTLEELERLSDQVLESISTYYGRDGAYSGGEIGCAELQSSFVEVMDSWIDYSTRGKAGWQGRLPPDLVERDERLYLGVQDVERLFEASILSAALTAVLSIQATGPLIAQAPDEGSREVRPRATDLGIHIGIFPAGTLDAITDVHGVRVGHQTLIVGDSIRTGITAILPHDRDLFAERVRAAIVVGNGFGKLIGSTQVGELGVIETPILLTGTLNVWRVADALVDTLLVTSGYEDVRSINPVVGETNDGWLSDIRARPLGEPEVRAALRAASGGPVEEGSVGAGTGTTALGFKGGIGTASRVVPARYGGYTVGVLVQTNFGGSLVVDGVPVGRIMAEERTREPKDARGGGSIMIVVATDAPLDVRSLERLAFRSFGGLARTGALMSHGSGDYAIAFTTNRDPPGSLDGGVATALFMAVQQATEQAILNSLFRATLVAGFGGHRAEAIPIEAVREILDSP